MSDDNMIELSKVNLDSLLRMFKGQLPVARIGILGKSTARAGETTNAEIGAKHEFGSDGMPIRSWLRMPLIEQFQNALDKAGAMNEEVLKKMVKANSLSEFVNKLGMVAVDVILEGFHTGGFGKWKPSNMEHKKNQQTLVETQQLRNSVTWEVKE